ncbi:hypothetical protein YC2023_010525 [Brassica napus]
METESRTNPAALFLPREAVFMEVIVFYQSDAQICRFKLNTIFSTTGNRFEERVTVRQADSSNTHKYGRGLYCGLTGTWRVDPWVFEFAD